MIYPACFWIEDTIQNRLASTAYLAINLSRFFEKISQHLKKKKIFI